MRCVFFGSPNFALGSLDALLKSRHEVVGVVTQPDRPAGRGMRLEPPPVKKRALLGGLPVHQPEKVNCEATYAFLEPLRPDVLAVVAYGEFLGARLLGHRRFPPVNVHPSLLPELRGAAPVQWALLRGYRRTGITTQFMCKEMDAGDILLQDEADLGENETAEDVLSRLSTAGGTLLVRTLDGLESGSLVPRPQDHSRATFAPLLTKKDGLLRFSETDAQSAHNQIRGLYPWPGSYGFINSKRVKVLRSALAPGRPARGAPGNLYLEGDRMFVACRDGALELLELQPEGRRPMLPREFGSGMKGIDAARFETIGE